MGGEIGRARCERPLHAAARPLAAPLHANRGGRASPHRSVGGEPSARCEPVRNDLAGLEQISARKPGSLTRCTSSRHCGILSIAVDRCGRGPVPSHLSWEICCAAAWQWDIVVSASGIKLVRPSLRETPGRSVRVWGFTGSCDPGPAEIRRTVDRRRGTKLIGLSGRRALTPDGPKLRSRLAQRSCRSQCIGRQQPMGPNLTDAMPTVGSASTHPSRQRLVKPQCSRALRVSVENHKAESW